MSNREVDIVKGAAFRAAREARGEDLRTVARRLDISPAWLSRLERGKEPWPEGENSLAVDPCDPCEGCDPAVTVRAPDNLMDFDDVNWALWAMTVGIGEVPRSDEGRPIPWPWWCKDCGWPLTSVGFHFEIELGAEEG